MVGAPACGRLPRPVGVCLGLWASASACGCLPRPVGVCLGLWASALTRGCLHRNPRPDLVTRATRAPGRAGPIEGRPDSVPDRGWGPAFGSSLWVAAVRRGLPVGGRSGDRLLTGRPRGRAPLHGGGRPQGSMSPTRESARLTPLRGAPTGRQPPPRTAPDSHRFRTRLPAWERPPERCRRTASGHSHRPATAAGTVPDCAPLGALAALGRARVAPRPERCQIAHHSGHACRPGSAAPER